MFRTVPQDLKPIPEGGNTGAPHKSSRPAHRMEINKPRNDRSRRRVQQIRGGSLSQSVRYNDACIFTQMSRNNTRTISIYSEEGKSSIEIVFGPKGD
ncbi:hypothetical protein D3C77_710220 [compost metagenome]